MPDQINHDEMFEEPIQRRFARKTLTRKVTETSQTTQAIGIFYEFLLKPMGNICAAAYYNIARVFSPRLNPNDYRSD